MKAERRDFGYAPNGETISLYVLDNGSMRAGLCDYGAHIVSIELPAGRGAFDDITLGFSSASGYMSSHPFFGSTIGRYANRIAKSRFVYGGKEYALAANDGDNTLHGGFKGFDKRLWRSSPFRKGFAAGVLFERASPDGEEGYPGNVSVRVVISLDANNTLMIDYEATSDMATPISLTNHSYFNLAGEGGGDILGHELRLVCSRYLPVGTGLIPTGEMAPVASTPYDFREGKRIGQDIDATGEGYDICFIIDRIKDGLLPCAALSLPGSKRRLEIDTTMPGIQLYTGNLLNGIKGKAGCIYKRNAGLCLETEFFPDSPNQPSFPSCWLYPGEVYRHSTAYRFSF